jgi:hypothetical protein
VSYLRIAKWDKHQHYKDRNPPWIKFYVELIDPNHKMNDLPVTTRYLWDRLLLLAAKNDNFVPNDPELIAKLLRMPPRTCREGIEQLLKGRWLQETSTKRRASRRASDVAPPEVRSRSRKNPLSPLKNQKLEALVRNGGFEYTDNALREELMAKGADDLLAAKLLKLAAELRAVAS